MKITSTSNPLVVPLTKLLQTKMLSGLLQLSKPLNATQALVILASNEEITLNIKTPLEKDVLYHAMLQKKGDTFIAQELIKLPLQLKQLLKGPAIVDLETLVAKLVKGETPKKIVVEALSQQILASNDKEQVSQLLDQLSQAVLTQNSTLLYSYRGQKGYVRFKDGKREFSQKVLRFEAYFPILGALSGEVSYMNGTKAAHLRVMSEKSKALLESVKDRLPMLLTVKVEKDLAIEVPVQKILDIKG